MYCSCVASRCQKNSQGIDGHFVWYDRWCSHLLRLTTPISCFNTSWVTAMILLSSCQISRCTTWRACTGHSITPCCCPWLLRHSSQHTLYSWPITHHYQPVWSSVWVWSSAWIPISSIIQSWHFYCDQRPVKHSFQYTTVLGVLPRLWLCRLGHGKWQNPKIAVLSTTNG